MSGAMRHWLQWQRDAWREFADPGRVLIYQMGKVGSTALQEAIPGALHLHSLYGHDVCPPRYGRMVASPLSKAGRGASRAIRRLALARRPEVRIVTFVRDPLERNISMFFQNLAHWLALDDVRHVRDTRIEWDALLADAFERSFNHEYALDWFDRELKRLTGIDVFARPFDAGQAATVFERGRYRVLLVRYERLREATARIADFVGTGSIDLARVNRGERKWYGALYAEFKRDYQAPPELLQRLYDSRYARHFYPAAAPPRVRAVSGPAMAGAGSW